MKKSNLLYLLIGTISASIGSILTTKYIVEKEHRKEIEEEERFRNKEFDITDNYIKEMAYSFKRKANRAKVLKKGNDVKKNNFLYRVLLEYARDMEKEKKKENTSKLDRKWIKLPSLSK